MGSRRDLWLLVGILVALVVIWVATVPGSVERSATDPRLSTYRVSPQGGLALRFLLEETGTVTERRRVPLTRGPLPPVLALLAPVEPPSPAEISALMTWLRGGGTLIHVPGPRDPVLDSLGLATVSLLPDSMPVLKEVRWEGTVAVPADHRWTEGIDSVSGISQALAKLPPNAEVVLEARDGRAVAVRLPVGEGSVLLLTSAEPLRNRSLRTSGAALLMVRAATELTEGGEALVFDEYHHGYRADAGPVGATAGFLRDTPPGRTVAQLLVLGVLGVLVAGRRFGRPLDRSPAPRRSPTEHVTALSTALRRAGARETARRLLLSGLARGLGRPPPATSEDRAAFLEWLEGRPRSREAAVAFVEEWKRGRSADLTSLARHADRITELEGAP